MDDHSKGWTDGYRAARDGRDTPTEERASQAYMIGFREGQDHYRKKHA